MAPATGPQRHGQRNGRPACARVRAARRFGSSPPVWIEGSPFQSLRCAPTELARVATRRPTSAVAGCAVATRGDDRQSSAGGGQLSVVRISAFGLLLACEAAARPKNPRLPSERSPMMRHAQNGASKRARVNIDDISVVRVRSRARPSTSPSRPGPATRGPWNPQERNSLRRGNVPATRESGPGRSPSCRTSGTGYARSSGTRRRGALAAR